MLTEQEKTPVDFTLPQSHNCPLLRADGTTRATPVTTRSFLLGLVPTVVTLVIVLIGGWIALSTRMTRMEASVQHMSEQTQQAVPREVVMLRFQALNQELIHLTERTTRIESKLDQLITKADK